jgi:ADP-ribose pyrophosphatase
MLTHWKTLSSRLRYQNPWWRYFVDQFQIPGQQFTGEYHYVQTYGSCMVVPVSADGRLLMVKQYRYLGDCISLEFPSGGVKAEQSHLQAAHAELQEETALQAAQMDYLGEFNPCKGITREICQVFIASQLQPAAVVKPDATEQFEVLYYHPQQLDEMIRSNQIWDGMTLAAWLLARHRVAAIIPP